MKQKPVTILLVVMTLLVAACTGTPTESPQDSAAQAIPARPQIQMNVGGALYDGLEGAFCWFQAVNDIECDPGPADPQPAVVVSVAPGETLTFTIGGESGPPSRLTATLLDDQDATGNPTVQVLDSDLTADFTVDLPPGQHRISVVAEYEGTPTDRNFVTSIFALDVGEAVAVALTPTVAAATPVPEATEELLPPTEVPTEEPTEAPTVAPTTEPPTEAPTLPPTEASTEEPSNTPVPATVMPAPTSPPPGELPAVVLVKGDTVVQPASIEYCASGAPACDSMPGMGTEQTLVLPAGETIRIDSQEPGPQAITIVLTNPDGSQELDRLSIGGRLIALYTFGAPAGDYRLHVRTTWPQGDITYSYQVQITQ
ncbi:MAG: hypothetical protein Kow0077_10570 [Anaerolineae bacterium]